MNLIFGQYSTSLDNPVLQSPKKFRLENPELLQLQEKPRKLSDFEEFPKIDKTKVGLI